MPEAGRSSPVSEAMKLLSGTRRYYADAIEETDWRSLSASLRRDSQACGWPKTLWSLLRHGVMPGLPSRCWRGVESVAREIGIVLRRHGIVARSASESPS